MDDSQNNMKIKWTKNKNNIYIQTMWEKKLFKTESLI